MKKLIVFAITILLTVQTQAQDKASWAIIQDEILTPKCVTCHFEGGPFAKQSGLVLTSDSAYEQLVNVQPTNQAAQADGLVRVGADGLASVHNSFLMEKIDARNEAHFYDDHPFYGALMPFGSEPLTNGEINLIEKWIEHGAPENEAIPGVDESLLADTTRVSDLPFEPLPMPEQGLQFHLGPFSVPANTEREFYYYEPLDLKEDIYVNRFEIAMRKGSHHFIFYMFSPNIPSDRIPTPDAFRDIYFPNGGIDISSLAAQPWQIFFAGTQWPRVNYAFPENVALRLPKGLGLDLNSHYANRKDEAVEGEIYGNLHTVDPAEVDYIADVLNIGNFAILLPPKKITTLQYVEKNRSLEDIHIFQLFSHAHEHMLEFRVEMVGGERDGELVYISYDWEHPPILDLDPPLTLRPGEGVKLVTTYNNWTDRTLRFGLLSQDEMMILFGYFYTGELAVGVADGTPTEIPDQFHLEQNYPNPFNPETTLRYFLPRTTHVNLGIYDINGKLIAELLNGEIEAGSHAITWNAADTPSGMYFARYRAGDFSSTRKMLLVK